MLKLKSVNFEQQQFEMHQLDQSHPEQLEWVIGRSSTCDLVLTNPEVSRVHGRILYLDGTYHFTDVGSTSGSLLNGETVPANDKRPLRPGDLIQLGETFLYVEELSPPAPSPSVPASPVCDLFLPIEKQWSEGDLTCRCSRIINETADVKTFCFTAEPPVLFNYKPGQFVNVEVEIDGKPVIRSYSISSSPSRPYHLALTVKRVPSPPDQPDLPPGLVSNWLHDHLKVGDRVKFVGGPLGHFTCLPEMPTKMLLISAGSGITPMMSMSRWVQDTLTNSDIVFLHSARTPEDIIFRNELEAMAVQMPNFRLAITLTQPAVGHPWMGLTGRISKSLLQVVAPDLMERSVYVCGPAGFMHGIKSTLEAMNFPMQNYKEESFGGRKAAPAKTTTLITRPVELKPVAAGAVTSNGKSHVNGHTNGHVNGHSNGHKNGNGRGSGNGNGNGSSSDPLSELLALSNPGATSAEPAVSFAKSGQDVVADGSTSILELAEQEGVQIRNACRVGACGACKLLCRQGQVRYDTPPVALTPADQKAGYVLACVAYPVNRVVVEA